MLGSAYVSKLCVAIFYFVYSPISWMLVCISIRMYERPADGLRSRSNNLNYPNNAHFQTHATNARRPTTTQRTIPEVLKSTNIWETESATAAGSFFRLDAHWSSCGRANHQTYIVHNQCMYIHLCTCIYFIHKSLRYVGWHNANNEVWMKSPRGALSRDYLAHCCAATRCNSCNNFSTSV